MISNLKQQIEHQILGLLPLKKIEEDLLNELMIIDPERAIDNVFNVIAGDDLSEDTKNFVVNTSKKIILVRFHIVNRVYDDNLDLDLLVTYNNNYLVEDIPEQTCFFKIHYQFINNDAKFISCDAVYNTWF